MQLDQLIIGSNRQQADLGEFLGGLTQTLSDQRMILAQEGTDHQCGVEILDFTEFQAQPRRAGALEIRTEIELTRTEIDVATAQAFEDFAQQIEFFQRRGRRSQCGDRIATMRTGDVLEAVRDVVEGHVPVDFTPLTALLDQRLGQTLIGIKRLVGKTFLVGNPAFIDRFVFARQNAHHIVVLDLNDQIGTNGVMRTDRLAALQFPRTGGVAERLRSQGTNRTEVDHIARQFGVDRATEEGGDLGMHVAVGHAKFHDPGDFLAKANAARAVNAAAHLFHGDQRSDILVEYHVLFFGVAALHRAVTDGHVLQLAFAALIADRTVQRMIDEQEFHHAFLCLDGQFGVRKHLHAVGHRRCAGRQRLRRLFHLHQTHPAIGGNR